VRFRLGPDRVAIGLGVLTKDVGEDMLGRHSELLMCDEAVEPAGAYERLIGDALRGDSTLFARQDAVEAAWRIVDGVIATANGHQPMPRIYADGSWGPADAGALAAEAGGWVDPSASC
jgi:glucose-6-phosphate 1-dehydrogenase